MTKERDLLRQAADALRSELGPVPPYYIYGLIQELEEHYLAAEPEAEPVAWPVDREWLRTVLRFAEKNPDYFYDVEPGFISLDSGDTDTIITALNKSAEPARKPMTEEEIKAEAQSEKFNRCDAIVFAAGVRFAERHHGIGGDDE